MLGAQSEHVLRAGHGALDTLVKSCAKERYPLLVPKMREQVAAIADEHRARCLAAGAPRGAPCLLPGFCLPKGLGPLQTVYLQGLMTGTPDLREAAAEALGEAIPLTSNPNPDSNPDPNPNPNPEPDPNPNPDPENDEHASARLGSSLHSGGDDHVGLLVYFVVGTFRQV